MVYEEVQKKVSMGILSDKTFERLVGSIWNKEEKIEHVDSHTFSKQPPLEPPWNYAIYFSIKFFKKWIGK